MEDEKQESKVKVEDLVQPEEELTAADEKDVEGGVGGASGGVWKTTNFLTTTPEQ